LGTPFLSLIRPFLVTNQSIQFKIKGRQVELKFASQPEETILNHLKEAIHHKEQFINKVSTEIKKARLDKTLEDSNFKIKVRSLEEKFIKEICSDLPYAFWHRKRHEVTLPYISNFNEDKIPTKARPIQMNSRLLEICKSEINELLKKGLIRKSSSPWSCAAFYVENAVEKERGVPRLVINYKPLNKIFQWIRYPIPYKHDLI
jgi:cysteinyl-tRNA synthetase